MLQPLTRSGYELLWDEEPLFYPNMVRISTIADGSCFFHAILNSHFVPYRSCTIDNIHISRQDIVREFRSYLAHRLAEPKNPADPESPIVYNCLGRGKMREFALGVPEYRLEQMQAEVGNPSNYADVAYLELVSEELWKDIYVLDAHTHDVYILGTDTTLYYKHRPSIVLLFLAEHFELVGILKPDGDVATLFDPDSPFIQKIKSRMDELIQERIQE